jgi:hypothetical protein
MVGFVRPSRALMAMALLAAFWQSGCAPPTSKAHLDHAIPEDSGSGQDIQSAFPRQGEHLVSPVLVNAQGISRAGLMVRLASEAVGATIRVEARGVDGQGQGGKWVPFSFTWSEGAHRVARADLDNVFHAVQWRIHDEDAQSIEHFTFSGVVPRQAETPENKDEVHLIRAENAARIRQALAGYLTDIGVVSRADWGARDRVCGTTETTKYRMAIHHTAGDPGSGDYAAGIRATQNFHIDTRGWCDIAYHFIVTPDGTVWEGREIDIRGGHTYGENTGNIGIVYKGCFQPGGCVYSSGTIPETEINDAMINNGGVLVGVLAGQYGIEVNEDTVKGHRDWAQPGHETACPGETLWNRLSEIRTAAGGDGTITPPDTGFAKGVVWDRSLTEGVNDSGNVRITNATVTCSDGQTMDVTGENAYWEFELDPGIYTFTATAPGYATASVDRQITAGTDVWGSIGLVPAADAVQLSVVVHNAAEGESARLSDALIEIPGYDGRYTDGSGEAQFIVPPQDLELSITRDGFDDATANISPQPAEVLELKVGLFPSDFTGSESPDDLKIPQIVIHPEEGPGGCGCDLDQKRDSNPGVLFAALVLLALGRKRRFFRRQGR